MTTHTFDLAAALVEQAIERLAGRDYGITRILFHEFGEFPLCANHTAHDTGHTVKMWAYDDEGLLAAAEASAPHVGGSPQGRIVNFRAGHLIFGALDNGEHTFVATGAARHYTLTARICSDHWTVTATDEPPQRFRTLDEALDHILGRLEPAPTA